MSQGSTAGGIPLRQAARGSVSPDGSARHHRAAIPIDRSVLWRPLRDPGDPGGPAEEGPYELFLTRSALRQINRRSQATESTESRFGFLLGRLYRCPESGVHYSVVDRVVPAAEPMSEDAPDPYLLRAWADAQAVFGEHGGVLVGWYHTHYLLGLMLSEGDREMNDRYFGEPWQCCVLTVPDPSRPMGAVFRPAGDEESIGGAIGSFRELLAVEDMPLSGPIPSTVRWKNYEPDREVRADEGEGEEARESEAPRVVPAQRGGETSTSSMTLVLADNEAERMYPRLPVRRRGIIWLLAIVAVAVGGYWGGIQLFESGGESPAPVTTPVTREPRVSPEVRRFQTAATELEQAMVRYEERRQDFDLGRIGCELLAGGYAGADEAFVTMAAAFAGLGTPADESMEPLESRYEGLVVDMNRLNQHFDASRCPRPE